MSGASEKTPNHDPLLACFRCCALLSEKSLYRCFECHIPFCWECIHHHCGVPIEADDISTWVRFLKTGEYR